MISQIKYLRSMLVFLKLRLHLYNYVLAVLGLWVYAKELEGGPNQIDK